MLNRKYLLNLFVTSQKEDNLLLMNLKAYIRILILVGIASMSFILFANSRSGFSQTNKDCPDSDKCCEDKKGHTDFIFFEFLSRNLLSANR